MSYGMSAALQTAIVQHLLAQPALAGVAIHDALPYGAGGGTYVLIGPEEVSDDSDKSGAGAGHRLSISVITDAAGFLAAKQIAGAVSEALEAADLALSKGRLVGLWFVSARARRRDEGAVRRIDLVFRARVEA